MTDLIWGQRVSGELWTHIFVSLEFLLRHWQAVIWGKYRRRCKFLNTVTGNMQQVWPYKLYKRKLYLSIYPTTALWNLEKKTEIWDKLSATEWKFYCIDTIVDHSWILEASAEDPTAKLGNANSDFVSLPSHQPAFKSLSKAVFEATPVLIEGPMGCGKSRLVERQAELSRRTEFKDFHRIQVI